MGDVVQFPSGDGDYTVTVRLCPSCGGIPQISGRMYTRNDLNFPELEGWRWLCECVSCDLIYLARIADEDLARMERKRRAEEPIKMTWWQRLKRIPSSSQV